MRSRPSPDDVALVAAGRRLEDRGLVVGSTGNLSVRQGDHVRITGSRVPYLAMGAEDLVTVEAAGGTVVEGVRAPSRELPLHLAVYRARPDAGAVVHFHGPCVTAWSYLGRPLEPVLEELEYYGIGPVRTSAPAPVGSPRLADAVLAVLGASRAALIGEHGAVTLAPTLAEALAIAEVVEHQAKVALLLAGAREPSLFA